MIIRWEKPGHSPKFGYDFWYQPRHNTMISSSWGAPAAFTKGFNLQHVSDGLYGQNLHVYSWPNGEPKQTLDLGSTGLLPLEVVSLDQRHDSYVLDMTNFYLFIYMVIIATRHRDTSIKSLTCPSFTDLQIRFLHDPSKDTGFVGCALTSNMVRFFMTPDGSWSHEVCKW